MSAFAASYADARAGFLHACVDADAELTSHRHPRPGPGGRALFLDTARLGAPDARRVLFVTSGTHGIEGFAGSAIQTVLVQTGLPARLPADVALVLVHAVNPFGFAWLRRVNEDNVDLNRNFARADESLPENPDYDRLYDALNPTAIDDPTLAAAQNTVRRFEQDAGPAAAYRALSGGQYGHPRGIQYGGRGPTWSNRVLRDVWGHHAGGAAVAVLVDLHSGLGPCGTGLLFQTARDTSREARLAAAWWPDVIRSEPATAGDAALATGLIGPAFTAAHPQAAAVGVVLEFGTRPMHEVALAVVKDNWLEHHGRRDSDVGRAIGAEMRHAFLLEDAAWRDTICRRAEQVIDAALGGMGDVPVGSA